MNGNHEDLLPTGHLVVVILLMFAPGSAAAYVDLGSGSILVQAAIGAVAVCVTAVKVYWSRISSFFRRAADKSKQPN